MTQTRTLPDCWWITPDISSAHKCADLLALLAKRFAQGISYIQFRQTQLNAAEFTTVYTAVYEYCQIHSISIMINGTAQQTQQLNAKGCYLNSDRLMRCHERPLSKDYWVGAYCHNLDELLHAQKLNLDFVSLSPVKKTHTHPEVTPLGWDIFETLAQQTTLPVYALGGLSLSDKQEAIIRGGQGIMGIRFY